MSIMLVTNTTSSMWSNAIELIGLLLLFCFILAASYYATKFIGSSKLRNSHNKNFEVIETMKIAQNKYLQIVRVSNKYIVVSIGKEDVRFITELDPQEVILPQANDGETNLRFAEVLMKLKMKDVKKK